MTHTRFPLPGLSQFTRFAAVWIAAMGLGGGAFARTVAIPELTSPITTIRLTGEETTLKLSNGQKGADGLTVATGNSIGCGLHAQVEQQGDILQIHLTRSGLESRWWCDPELRISMPPELGLQVEVEKLVADIHGSFGAVAIDAADSVVNFTGDAERFRLTGAKAISRLKFGAATKRENVEVRVPLNLSHVSFDKN